MMRSFSRGFMGGVGVLLSSMLLASAGCATAPRSRPVPVVVAPVEPSPPEVPAPEPPKEKTVRELFTEAVAAFEAGEVATAEEGFRKVLEKAPESVNARFNLGFLAERQGRLEEAQSAYESLEKEAPGHLPTLLHLGRLYRRQGRYADAVALYEAGRKQQGLEHEASLLNELTVAWRQSGKLDKAEATSREVLARHPEDLEAQRNLAIIHYEKGHYRLAELVVLEALTDHEKDAGLHNELGRIALKQGDRTRALVELRKALELDASCVPCHLNLGAVALAWRDYGGAERAFRKAVELAPDSVEAWRALARALDGQKGRESRKGLEAGDAFEKVLTVKPEDAEALCGAGWGYAMDRAGWDKATGYLTRCQGLPGTSGQERQAIDAKLKSIEALRNGGQPSPAEGGGDR